MEHKFLKPLDTKAILDSAQYFNELLNLLIHQVFWKCANWKERLFMLFNFFISQWCIMTELASKK